MFRFTRARADLSRTFWIQWLHDITSRCWPAQVYGIKYGLRGFYDRASKPVHLTPEMVDGIQLKGGTILVRSPCAT